MFQCGCVFAFDWSRGWRDCNIHDPSAPHCPWCACATFLGGNACYISDRKAFIFFSVLAYLVSVYRGRSFEDRIRDSLLTWLAYGLLAGLFFFLVLAPDYPWFFGYSRPSVERPAMSFRIKFSH